MTATVNNHKQSVTLVLRDNSGKKLRRVRIYMDDEEQAKRLMTPWLWLPVNNSTICQDNVGGHRLNTCFSDSQ